jgi:hypothetical protein
MLTIYCTKFVVLLKDVFARNIFFFLQAKKLTVFTNANLIFCGHNQVFWALQNYPQLTFMTHSQKNVPFMAVAAPSA